MINPSINGWIEKFFVENDLNFIDYSNDYNTFYSDIRQSGFIYGHVVSLNLKTPIDLKGLSHDEVTKIALLNSMFSIYRIVKQNKIKEDFITQINLFYKKIQHENYNFLNKLLPSGSQVSILESNLNDRIQTNNNIISKNFSHIITNALLFLDVLAFHEYLVKKDLSTKYLKEFELNCIKVVSLAFSIKKVKSNYDELLIKLFENSLRYTKFKSVGNLQLETIPLEKYDFEIEKLYLLDLAQMALWSDELLEIDENIFLNKLALKLNVPLNNLIESTTTINIFIKEYKNEIPFFNYSNPVKHFYDQTNNTVTKLITRNKKRLTKEIIESKELMILLAQSTTRELDSDEKKKVKKQLLDICKSVPSLTIFLLPGGGILLPILIKYIPQLLPSAFNENLED
ncbi:LETM1-related biofilm-associated protein [Flavobacterium sp. N2270]|uniref:LETM1-related biofilm-associated protein n=1 Tax=Flavobacterium sp. N2270 TaxID=2986831 RepID=UPI00222494DF|nr:LETM1-related biofilm-associated protein [Flavobacterium sp. N2270]